MSLNDVLAENNINAYMPLDGWVRSLDDGVGKRNAINLRITTSYPTYVACDAFKPDTLVALQRDYTAPSFRVVRVIEERYLIPFISTNVYVVEVEPYELFFDRDREFLGACIDPTRLEIPEPHLPLWLEVGLFVQASWKRIKTFVTGS